jgi:phage baseplate assembly protein V
MAAMHDDDLRALSNLIRYGTVDSVDHATKRAILRVGGLLTKPLPWLAARAGNVAIWSPPSTGEQVMVLAPNGDLGAAAFIAGIFSDAAPAPASASADNVVILTDDGAEIIYDRAAHKLQATLPAGGTVDLTAPGGVTIAGDVAITGKVTITGDVAIDGKTDATGTITSDSDVKAGSISLVNHKHGGVQSGGSKTGMPE